MLLSYYLGSAVFSFRYIMWLLWLRARRGKERHGFIEIQNCKWTPLPMGLKDSFLKALLELHEWQMGVSESVTLWVECFCLYHFLNERECEHATHVYVRSLMGWRFLNLTVGLLHALQSSFLFSPIFKQIEIVKLFFMYKYWNFCRNWMKTECRN
jgi:hypothetical protein